MGAWESSGTSVVHCSRQEPPQSERPAMPAHAHLQGRTGCRCRRIAPSQVPHLQDTRAIMEFGCGGAQRVKDAGGSVSCRPEATRTVHRREPRVQQDQEGHHQQHVPKQHLDDCEIECGEHGGRSHWRAVGLFTSCKRNSRAARKVRQRNAVVYGVAREAGVGTGARAVPDHGFARVLHRRGRRARRGAFDAQATDACTKRMRLYVVPVVTDVNARAFHSLTVLQRWVTWQRVMTLHLPKDAGPVTRMAWSPDGASSDAMRMFVHNDRASAASKPTCMS